MQYRNRPPGADFGPGAARRARSCRKRRKPLPDQGKTAPPRPNTRESEGIAEREIHQKTEFTDRN